VHAVSLATATQLLEGKRPDMDIVEDVHVGKEESLGDDDHFAGLTPMVV
jgi:hypothetical protein